MKHLKTLAAIIAGLWYCMNVSATTDNLPNDTEGYTENGFLWLFRVDPFTSTASLSVYGDGAMDNYTSSSRSPWSSYLKYVDYIEIGGDVTSIGDYAFAIAYDNDTKLKNISMPSTLTSIGKSAFSNICATTPLVVLPEGVTNIGDDAFYNIGKRNNKFARVVLPSTLKSIGNYAFYCNAGTDEDSYWIDVYSLASTPPFISSNTFYISDNENASVYCPNPSAYSTWLDGAYIEPMPFSSYGINDHTGIQFWGYKNGVLHLYQTGKSISAYNNINRNNVSSIRIQGYDITSIADKAFYGYTNLKSIEIPSTVENIHSSAFEGCISLKTVTIPDDCALLSIGEKAFSGCQSLTSFTIPGSVVGLQSNSFEGCFFAHSNFVNNSIYVNEYTAGATIYSGKEYDGLFMDGSDVTGGRPQLTSITIPNTALCIKAKAFEFCTKLTDITLPNSIRYIDEEALYHCTALTDIYFNCNPSLRENSLPKGATIHLNLSDEGATNFNANNANTYDDITYERELPTGKYGTIILPFAPDAESLGNFIFYELTSVDGISLVFDEVENPQANTPYLYTLREGKETTQITGGRTTINDNINNPETVNNMQMIGSFTNQTIEPENEANIFFYAYTADDNKLHRVMKELTVKPYRAYFTTPSFVTSGTRSFNIYVRSTDGIKYISTENIDNFNQLMYDLSGRPTSNPIKGNIYIKNGKKEIFR